MEIKILGGGCAKCGQLEKMVRDVVAENNIDAVIVKVTDFAEIAKLGVLTTPALVIDGEVKVSGRIPGKKEIVEFCTS